MFILRAENSHKGYPALSSTLSCRQAVFFPAFVEGKSTMTTVTDELLKSAFIWLKSQTLSHIHTPWKSPSQRSIIQPAHALAHSDVLRQKLGARWHWNWKHIWDGYVLFYTMTFRVKNVFLQLSTRSISEYSLPLYCFILYHPGHWVLVPHLFTAISTCTECTEPMRHLFSLFFNAETIKGTI